MFGINRAPKGKAKESLVQVYLVKHGMQKCGLLALINVYGKIVTYCVRENASACAAGDCGICNVQEDFVAVVGDKMKLPRDHPPFPSLLDKYGLEYDSLIEGCHEAFQQRAGCKIVDQMFEEEAVAIHQQLISEIPGMKKEANIKPYFPEELNKPLESRLTFERKWLEQRAAENREQSVSTPALDFLPQVSMSGLPVTSYNANRSELEFRPAHRSPIPESTVNDAELTVNDTDDSDVILNDADDSDDGSVEDFIPPPGFVEIETGTIDIFVLKEWNVLEAKKFEKLTRVQDSSAPANVRYFTKTEEDGSIRTIRGIGDGDLFQGDFDGEDIRWAIHTLPATEMDGKTYGECENITRYRKCCAEPIPIMKMNPLNRFRIDAPYTKEPAPEPSHEDYLAHMEERVERKRAENERVAREIAEYKLLHQGRTPSINADRNRHGLSHNRQGPWVPVTERAKKIERLRQKAMEAMGVKEEEPRISKKEFDLGEDI